MTQITNTAETKPKHLSRRQLKTIYQIPQAKLDIHCGPYGCGKTYSVDIGIGQFCMTYKAPRDGSVILLIGKTAQAVKMNICNILAAKFGNNFRYDSGRKDGFTKDAVLFGHFIRIVGLNDSNAEERIRGINAYKIFADEVSTWSEDNFDKVIARLRGSVPEGSELGFVGTTNPDSPTHWLWKRVNEPKSPIRYIQWTEYDRPGDDAIEYYNKLRQQYQYNDAYLQRYVYGHWTAAEGLVYPEFRDKAHVVTDADLQGVKIKSLNIGIDFGVTNATAILLIAEDTEGSHIVLEEIYLKDCTLTKVIGHVRRMVIDNYKKLDKVYIDPASAVLIKELQDEGMRNIQGGNNRVLDGINYVKDLFTEDKLFIHESCTNLIDELYTYAWSDKDGETVKKVNDHACDALRYGIYSQAHS